MRNLLFTILALPLFVLQVSAKTPKVPVRVVNRQTNRSEYGYIVPGYARSRCVADGYGNTASSGCSVSGMPALAERFQVRGATLSLLLPDSRIVVVNCDAKINWTDRYQGQYRSCRVPLAESVEAEFKGDRAKLTWTVSVDGKKKESETYKIIAVLSKMPMRTEGLTK